MVLKLLAQDPKEKWHFFLEPKLVKIADLQAHKVLPIYIGQLKDGPRDRPTVWETVDSMVYTKYGHSSMYNQAKTWWHQQSDMTALKERIQDDGSIGFRLYTLQNRYNPKGGRP